jgi:hypothetical protein
MPRLCKICGVNPACLPDRETLSNRTCVCSRCHSLRIIGDLTKIVELQNARRVFIVPPVAQQDMVLLEVAPQ